MVSQARSGASWALLLILMVSDSMPWTSALQQDLVTDLSLQPAQRMIDASWRLMNSTGEVASFHVEWREWRKWSESWSYTVIHSCTVNYLESESQPYSTDQCNWTPMLLPDTEYTVRVKGRNDQGTDITEQNDEHGRTLPVLTDLVTDLSLQPAQRMIDASWRLMNSTGEVASFHVEWREKMSGTVDRSCIVNYHESGSQQYNTYQCNMELMLLPDTEYIVDVEGLNSRGRGITKWIQMIGRTLPIKQAPDSVTSLRNTSAGVRFITLTWQRPDTQRNITGYHITYYGMTMTGKKHGQNGSVSVQIHLQNATYNFNLTSLMPYSSYNVCVVVENQEEKSLMNCLMNLHTEQATVPSNQSNQPGHLVPLIIGGIFATAALTAAILAGVILWKQCQRKSRLGHERVSSLCSSLSVSTAAMTPTTTTKIALVETSTITEADEETRELIKPSLPLRPMPPLPVEEVYTASESLAGHDYCYALTGDMRRDIVQE